MKLRPYQQQAIASTLACFREHRAVLIVLATGGGKTVIFSHLAHQWERGRVLVLAHREELIFQAAEKIMAITGAEPGIEMAELQASRLLPAQVVVSSVQTLCRPQRLARYNPAEFGLIIVDEAHHSTANTYLRILDYFTRGNPDLKILGVTATPRRADQAALGQIYTAVALDYGIEPAIRDGWLVPLSQRVIQVDSLDFSRVDLVAGDLSESQLDEILSEEEPLHAVAAATVKEAGSLPTIVFCVTVRHATLMAEILNRYRKGSARALSGKTPKDERRQLLADFRTGLVQFLCNVGVLLEGFDAPAAACLAMARPTASIVIYTQSLGRITRPLPGVIDPFAEGTAEQRKQAIAASAKPSALVLDFVGNAGRHKLISAADVLGGSFDLRVREYARKTLEQEGRPADVGWALDRAHAELELLHEEEERRKAREKIRAVAEYRAYEVSPFGAATTPRGGAYYADGPTEKQINYLVYLGVDRETARGYTKKQASTVIDALLKKRRQVS